MKNLLSLLGLTVIVLAAVGWYQGWYKLNVSRNLDGTLRVQTDVNTQQAGSDLSTFGKKVEGLGQTIIDKSGAANATTPASTPAPQPPQTASTPNPEPALKEGAGWLLGNVLGKEPAKQ